MNYKELARDIIKKAKTKNTDEAEVYLLRANVTRIDILNQEIESSDHLEDIGYGIRIIKEKKLGFSFSSGFDSQSIDETISKALSNASAVVSDEFNSLPSPAKVPSLPDIYDEEILKTPIEEKIEIAKTIEESAYKFDKRVKKTEKVSYHDAEYEIIIVNSAGIDISFKGTNCEATAQIVAEKDGNIEVGFGVDSSLKFKKLNARKAGEEAAKRAIELLGAKGIGSQKIPLILDPFIGAELLGSLAGALSAESVQKGKSLFAGKIGKKIGSGGITIVDDGRLKGGLASAPYDAEGVPTKETILIKDGILSTYIYNVYTANKDRVKSTGNARRFSYKSLPIVSPSNIYIKAGKTSHEEIIKSVKKGLYITKVMGMHTANPISGEFSIGASGILIENGSKSTPVRGITIAGNLIELLESIDAVGSDLRFILSTGSPTLLISGITISG